MKVEPRDQINPCWIEKYRTESYCDGRETSARLESAALVQIPTFSIVMQTKFRSLLTDMAEPRWKLRPVFVAVFGDLVCPALVDSSPIPERNFSAR